MKSVGSDSNLRAAMLRALIRGAAKISAGSGYAKPTWLCLALLALLICAAPAFSQSIHLLSYAAPSWTWTDMDLSLTPGFADIGLYSGIAAFVTTPNDQFHVYYQDASSDIRQLYFNGYEWSDEDLTTTRGRPALWAGGITGFSIGNFQYVYFVGSDQHIHEYSYINNWVDQDLTILGHGVLAGPSIRLVAFVTTPNDQRHVYYVALDGSIHQLYFNGASWSDGNLTGATHGAKAPTTPAQLAGCAIGNHQYVFFTGSDTHLHEFSYINSWTDTDWTDIFAVTKFVAGTSAGPVTGFAIPGTPYLKMYFNNVYDCGSSTNCSDVEQLSYDDANPSNWTLSDLTDSTTGSLEETTEGSVGFATTPNDQLHLYVRETLFGEFYFNGSFWSYGELPGGADVTAGSLMGGFSIGNSQYLFYVLFVP